MMQVKMRQLIDSSEVFFHESPPKLIDFRYQFIEKIVIKLKQAGTFRERFIMMKTEEKKEKDSLCSMEEIYKMN